MPRRDLNGRSTAVLAFVVALVAAACSSGSDGTDTVDRPSETTAVDVAPEVDAASTQPVPSTDVDDDDPGDGSGQAGPWTLRVDYAIVAADGGNGGRDGLDGVLDPLSDEPVDPFTELASCSGWRSSVTAYSLLAQGDGDTRLVSLSVADAVTGAGTYDALVRVERDDRALEFVGTATLADDLRSGEFLAFGVDGERIDGVFRCDGTEPPQPLELGDPSDDRLDTIEVTALLRQDGRALIVGLAAVAEEGAVCEAIDGDSMVSVAGDATIGSMTAFDLASDPARLAVTVGGTEFVFDSFETLDVIADDASRVSGTFGADAGGVEIDGAYRCT